MDFVTVTGFRGFREFRFLRGKFHPEILSGSPERERQTREGWGKRFDITRQMGLQLLYSTIA